MVHGFLAPPEAAAVGAALAGAALAGAALASTRNKRISSSNAATFLSNMSPSLSPPEATTGALLGAAFIIIDDEVGVASAAVKEVGEAVLERFNRVSRRVTVA